MGRRPNPTTAAVLHQIDAWCLLDRLEEELPLRLRPAIWPIKRKIEAANGLLEGMSERSE